jgi:SDR family mycofactocin-dependent oxidoreductase
VTQGRVALVTGAARGIGAATVRALVAQGYGVLAMDWCVGDHAPAHVPYPLPTSADLTAVAESCGPDVIPYVGDVRNFAQVSTAVQKAVDRWGRLDAAVAAAAVILGGAPLWETPEDDLRALMEIDAFGVWHTAAAAIPAMLNNPRPHECRFVAVASAAAHHGLHRLAAYNAAKHAVAGIVKGLSADLIGTGVTACAVSPGSTETEMLRATATLYQLPDPTSFAAQQRIGRLIEAAEIADVIAFCCSVAGAPLNGSVVNADGGFPA